MILCISVYTLSPFFRWRSENSNQNLWSTISCPIKLPSENSESERALCADSASFRMALNRDATTDLLISAALRAARSNTWASTLDKTSHYDKHVGIWKDRTSITLTRTNAPAITLAREELRSLKQVKEEIAVEASIRRKIKSKSRNFLEKAICNFFAARYCPATECIKNFSFSFVENVITERILREVLDESIN